MRTLSLWCLACACLALSSCKKKDAEPIKKRHDGRPNVVLIMLDTTRPDYLGFHGHDKPTSPFLDSVAKQSVVFPLAVSTSSWTAPSTASVFTGLYPTHHGVIQGTGAHERHMRQLEKKGRATIPLNRIPDSARTLPEVFQAAGYQTFGIATNLNVGPHMGFTRGFDWFRQIHGDKNRKWGFTRRVPYGTAEEVQNAVSSMQETIKAAQPYFLYLHFNDPHKPYLKREPWYQAGETEREDVIRVYESEIRYMDEVIKDIYKRLELHQDTILAVVSDHGEAMGEHGYYEHPPQLHAEVNRVLFMISWPDGRLSNSEPTYRASLIDVFPTLVDLAGIADSTEIDGTSLAKTITEGTSDELTKSLRERTLFAHRQRRGRKAIWAAMQGDWKLITRPDGSAELFNLKQDPEEKNDVSAGAPEMHAKLMTQLSAFKKTTAPDPAKTSIEIDKAEFERLKALGYVE